MMKVIEGFECKWYYRVAASLLFGVIVGLAVSSSLLQFAFNSEPPIRIKYVEALNSKIKQGEFLTVRVHREKKRDDCTLVSESWVQSDLGTTIDLPDYAGPGGEPRTEFTDVIFDTRTVPLGRWSLVVNLLYFCPGQSFAISQPIVAFEVI